jgi:hypothetical protein
MDGMLKKIVYQQVHNGLFLTVSRRCQSVRDKLMREDKNIRTSTMTFPLLVEVSPLIHSIPEVESVVRCLEWRLVPSTCEVDLDKATRSSSSTELLLDSISGTVANGGLPGGENGDELDPPAAAGADAAPCVMLNSGPGFLANEDSPTSTSSSVSSEPSLDKLCSTASNLSRCSSTVTPVVPGCTRWNFRAKGTGRGTPGASVAARRIGGGNSPVLCLLCRLGTGTLLIDSCGDGGPFGVSWITSSIISTSSFQTRTLVRRVSSSGPKLCQASSQDVGSYTHPHPARLDVKLGGNYDNEILTACRRD